MCLANKQISPTFTVSNHNARNFCINWFIFLELYCKKISSEHTVRLQLIQQVTINRTTEYIDEILPTSQNCVQKVITKPALVTEFTELEGKLQTEII